MPVLDPIHLDAVDTQGSAPAVAASGLTRRYGQGATAVDALRGVDLTIEAGEMVAVMGPSGSGKSTLMHLLAGLDRPTSGSVTIAGQDITKLKEAALTPPPPRSHRLRLPGLQPAPDAHRRGERRPADPPRRPHERRGTEPHRQPDRPRRASPIASATAPPSSPAVSSSASPSHARSSPSRPSSSRTSRPATSTPARRPRCSASCATRRTTSVEPS